MDGVLGPVGMPVTPEVAEVPVVTEGVEAGQAFDQMSMMIMSMMFQQVLKQSLEQAQ